MLFEGRDRLHGQGGNFTIVECASCGLIYLDPRPDSTEIDRYYPEDYISYPKAIEDESSKFRKLDRRYGLYKRCNEVIKRTGKAGRILDVGSATGIFLYGMKQRGWETFGVEPSHHAAEFARKRFNLEVVEGYLEEAHFESGYFDVVTLWDVLEHVPSPRETLKEISRILKPNGWLVLSLPNPNSWERKWFGKHWAGWDVPRHFHIFNQNTLTRYLQTADLKLVEISSFTGRHGVLVLNIQFWLTDLRLPPTVKKWILGVSKSLPARILTYPFYNVADRLNKSSIMAVFAQKQRS